MVLTCLLFNKCFVTKICGKKRIGKVNSRFTKEQNTGHNHSHTSGPSPPGMSYKTTKNYLASVKAAKDRILSHLPWWCYCRWEESGPVWLFFSLLAWLHWDKNVYGITQTQSSEETKIGCVLTILSRLPIPYLRQWVKNVMKTEQTLSLTIWQHMQEWEDTTFLN